MQSPSLGAHRHSKHNPRCSSIPSFVFHLLFFSTSIPRIHASITVYYPPGQNPFLTTTTTTTAAAADYTGAAAYNPTVLIPPPPPDGLVTQFDIPLTNGDVPGLGIQQSGSFMGFSIEMSVVNQVLGRNASHIQVPFLNLMANLQQRSGHVLIRVGGNTQDFAVLVDSLPDGQMIEKDVSGVSNPTQTPPLVFTPELLYMLRNISSLVDVRWFLGIPFNDTSNFRLGIAEAGEAILGDYLLGYQVANEPDLYARHDHRPDTYGPQDYFNEFGSLVEAMKNDAKITRNDLLIGPNIASADWQPDDVWNTGFIDTYSSSLAFLSVEHYPTDNCFAQFGVGTPRDAQDLFPTFLTHDSPTNLVAPYLSSTALAQEKGKKFLMMETNTGSCGGFAGLSDSFGAALWGLDFGLKMASSGFSAGLMHVGGQNVFYNPFTPPPTNQSTFHQWTIGPIYYSSLVMAEMLGASNQSQVLDLPTPGNFTPAYAIYEGGVAKRVGLFNYVSEPEGSQGANMVTVNIRVANSDGSDALAGKQSVKVKYLSASSVAQKYNFTWAGQTFGNIFESDGRPMGALDIQSVPCSVSQPPASQFPDPNTGEIPPAPPASTACTITVPAPGFALVFLTDDAQTAEGGPNGGGEGGPSVTFSTTAFTKLVNTATVDPAVLQTSNGHKAVGGHLGSTSKGSANGAVGGRVGGGGGQGWAGWVVAVGGVVLSVVVGGWMVV
ncbi:hypothetical protein AX16_008155 [Volvariella volvacea WC 439]|nr:hypothetical protein AX16_008155 [Volvariella volvacea WC 439]